MDPSERLTCEQLLQHPYFDSLREKSEKTSREQDRSSNKRTRLPRKHLPPGVSDLKHQYAAIFRANVSSFKYWISSTQLSNICKICKQNCVFFKRNSGINSGCTCTSSLNTLNLVTVSHPRTLYMGEKYNKNQIKRAEAGGCAVLLIDTFSVLYFCNAYNPHSTPPNFPQNI